MPQIADVDECTVNIDGCDQECANTDGSFGCSCRDGFRLDNDGRRCNGESPLGYILHLWTL